MINVYPYVYVHIYIFIPTRFPKLVNSGWEKNTPASANPRKGLFGMVKFFFKKLPKNLIKKSIGDCHFFRFLRHG